MPPQNTNSVDWEVIALFGFLAIAVLAVASCEVYCTDFREQTKRLEMQLKAAK